MKNFEKEFENEETELLVLIQKDIGGAVVDGDYLCPSAAFLASVDVKTGALSRERGRLEWRIKRTPQHSGWGFDLAGMTAYRVRVRRAMEKKPEARYLLLEILESGLCHEGLEEIRAAYQRPVVIEAGETGSFLLDRDYEWYEGEMDWLGHACEVMLELDEGRETAEGAMEALLQLAGSLEGWDERIRSFAAANLVELANDWQDEEEITPEEFKRRMEISGVRISADGGLSVTFLDDNMFWGHWIVVEGNISGELESADIEG